jgi:hypothetical protein
MTGSGSGQEGTRDRKWFRRGEIFEDIERAKTKIESEQEVEQDKKWNGTGRGTGRKWARTGRDEEIGQDMK